MGLWEMGGGGVVGQILLLTNLLQTLNQVGYERNSPVRTPLPHKESLIVQGSNKLHCPFHSLLHGIKKCTPRWRSRGSPPPPYYSPHTPRC